MKLFKCNAQMALKVVELPRRNWRVLPPKKWQIALTMAGIVIAAVVWAVL